MSKSAASTDPAGSSLVAEKRALRQVMRARREELPAESRAQASRELTERLLALPEFIRARCLSAYVPTRGEVDVSAAVASRVADGVRVAYPRVTADRPRLRFCEVQGDTPLVPGVFGIFEPPEDSPRVPLEEIEVLLLPGLAFDSSGRRLGYGGGYYDETGRLLRQSGRGLLIGVGYEFQLIEHCPAGEQDIAIDFVVTESRVIRCRRETETQPP
jgi:5-formyltetrahydrofolate cyclo-ligase